MLNNAAPKALNPPTTTMPSAAPTKLEMKEPAITSGPMPGTIKSAEPKSKPQSPPQNAPNFPQYLARSPIL